MIAQIQIDSNGQYIQHQENDELRKENIALKELIKNPQCNNCGLPTTLENISSEEQRLLVENAMMRDMLSRLSSLRESGETSGYLPPPAAYNAAMNLSVGPSDVGRSQLGDGLPVGSNHDYQVSNAFRVVSSRGAVNYTVDDKVPSAENYFR